MAHSQIIIMGCFSREIEFTIPLEFFHNLCQFKFDGKGELIVLGHFFRFIQFFFLSNGIHCKYVQSRLFILKVECRVEKWCHTLPNASIHSFDQLVKELHEAFEKYDYQDVCDRINQIRMKYGEYLEDFLNRFLHLCYEFPGEYFDYNFISERFYSFNFISLKLFESKPLEDSSLQTYVDHETPHIRVEEPTGPFVPCPPPFSYQFGFPLVMMYKLENLKVKWLIHVFHLHPLSII